MSHSLSTRGSRDHFLLSQKLVLSPKTASRRPQSADALAGKTFIKHYLPC